MTLRTVNRLLLLSLVGLISALGFAIDRQYLIDYTHYKNLSIQSPGSISSGEVKALLPLDRSTLWWYLNLAAIESRVKGDARVAKARLERCELKAGWGCFNLQVLGRKSQYLVQFHGESWLAAADGTLISQYEEPSRETSNDEIVALFTEDEPGSSESLRANIVYLADAAEAVASEVSVPVESLTIQRQGDLLVKLREMNFPILFSLPNRDLSILGREARRLTLILQRFKGKEHLIEAIDLPYDKVVVVKLLDTTK